MEELGNITKSKGVLLEMKAKVIHTLIFPITRYECKSRMVKKADRKKKRKLIHLKYGIGGELYGYPRPQKDKQVGSKALT